ncbi:MAG: hypothetical protein PWR21_432 [Methanoculleus sp.]|nr:hypothetical protein [Methanoculleus sp.]MDK2988783.1 hypothetical protein [Methanoculleus sp.]
MTGKDENCRKMRAPVVKGSISTFFVLCLLLTTFIVSAGCTSQTSSAVPLPDVTPHDNSQEYRDLNPEENNTLENSSSHDPRFFNAREGMYSINASFPDVSKKIMVYTPEKPEYTKEWVSSLAKKFGMSGKVRESEKAYYADEAETDDYYFVVLKDDRSISFKSYHQQSGDPPSPENATKSVKEFLESAGLAFPGATEAGINYDTGGSISSSGEYVQNFKQIVVTFNRELNGISVLGSSIMARVDAQGNIIELFFHWPDYKPYKEVSLKSPEQAFAEYLEYQKDSLYITGAPMKPEKVVVTRVSLFYRSTGKYVEPIYVFQGYGQQGEVTQPFASVYVVATDEGLERWLVY